MIGLKASRLILVLIFMAGILIVANLVLGTIALNKTNRVAQQNQQFVQCVSRWANATAARSSALTKLSLRKNTDLDLFLRTFASALTHPPTTPAGQAKLKQQATTELQDYVNASNAYNRALKNHPLPRSPKFACSNTKS